MFRLNPDFYQPIILFYWPIRWLLANLLLPNGAKSWLRLVWRACHFSFLDNFPVSKHPLTPIVGIVCPNGVRHISLTALRHRQNGHHLADNIFKCVFLNNNCCILFWFRFHWNLFLKVQFKINQDGFRSWLGATQATSHYLKLCWPSLLTHVCVTQSPWVNCRCQHRWLNRPKEMTITHCDQPCSFHEASWWIEEDYP